MLFMRGDLQHAVGAGIGDGLASADMLLTKILDHLRTGCMAERQKAWQLAAGHDAVDQVLRQGGDGMREISPVELQRNAGDFPVSGNRILAARDFPCHAELADERHLGQRIAAGRKFSRLAQTE